MVKLRVFDKDAFLKSTLPVGVDFGWIELIMCLK